MSRRVVITGLGSISPAGKNTKDLVENMKQAYCGIDFIESFDSTDFKTKLGGEVKNFSPKEVLGFKKAKRMERFTQFAMVAAKEAMEDSKIDIEKIDKNRFGVIVGSGVGGIGKTETEAKVLEEKGNKRVNPLFIPMIISNMAAGNIAIEYQAKGLCTNVVTACATGSHCIGDAYRNIKHGYGDIILAGGAEASITPLSVAGFAALQALSTSEDPKRASIPFDKDRDGFVMGEGAGILVLEEYEHAKNRGAKIYGEIVGYGATCDAFHITAPADDGDGARRAMELAMEEANIGPEDISYINAHGTSTPMNDKLETMAIKDAFGDHAYKIPISSTKSMTGHLLGAAGAVEAIICIKALEEGYIPPTIGLINKDEDCDLDYVAGQGRQAKLNYALSNSLGFGGHNASLIFKKMED